MEFLTLKKIELKDTIRKANDPLEFDLEMHCKEDLEDKVIFTVYYTVNVSDDNEDQILSETEIYPIPKGNIKFSLEADAPSIREIPHDQLFGLTSILIVGKYKEEQFIRIGYIVDIYYPGIPNDKLLYNEDDGEDIVDEELEEEEEEENENFDDLIVEDDSKDGMKDFKEDAEVEDNSKEDAEVEDNSKEEEENGEGNKEVNEEVNEEDNEEENGEGNKEVNEEVNEEDNEEGNEEDEVSSSEYNKINDELEKPLFDDQNPEDIFKFRGFTINYNFIEMNVMVPPTVHTFLIKWKNDEDQNLSDLEEEETSKKVKLEE